MNKTIRSASHPTDGDLAGYLDQQVTGEERRSVVGHLSRCEECTLRLRALSDQSSVVSGYLAGLEEGTVPDELTRARALAAARRAAAEQRSSGRLQGWHRAAAAVAVFVFAVVAVDPVRAWVVDRWESLVGEAEPVAVHEASPAPVLERGSLVSFAPVGDVFVLEVEHAQEVGTVTVELRDVSRASAQIVNGSGESILVLPSGLRVENAPESEASYRVTLPGSTKMVQVFSGGVPVVVVPVEGESVPWSHTVPLDPEVARR